MHELHGGYVSAAIWEDVLNQRLDPVLDWKEILHYHSHFVVSQKLLPGRPTDPRVVLLQNLLVRGLPTLPSLRVEKALSRKCGLTTLTCDGVARDTKAYQTRYEEDPAKMRPFIERAICLQETPFEPGPAPGFRPPEFDSQEEERFFFGPLRKALGPVMPMIECQRSFDSIVSDKRFTAQRADFCLEFSGSTGNSKRGAVMELDGSQHDRSVDASKQSRLDRERDAACRQAGWIPIRVKVFEMESILGRPELGRLREHPFWQRMAAQQPHPLSENPDGNKVRDLIWLPLGVARVQATLLYLLEMGKLSLDAEVWRLCVIERDLSCVRLAIKDFRTTLQAVLKLYYPGSCAPQILLQVVVPADPASVKAAQADGGKQPYDALLDFAVLSRYDSAVPALPDISTQVWLSVRGSHRPLRDRILATTETPLPPLSVEPEAPLQYFLRSLFRKRHFREKQVEIVSLALRRQSCVALLPTGAGKSLTYQLSAMLMNGVVLIEGDHRPLGQTGCRWDHGEPAEIHLPLRLTGRGGHGAGGSGGHRGAYRVAAGASAPDPVRL